jgi:hypothetical protein
MSQIKTHPKSNQRADIYQKRPLLIIIFSIRQWWIQWILMEQ